MKNHGFTIKDHFKNPYLMFSPFLVFFIAYVFISPTDGIFADQLRYLFFGQNLVHGIYSPPAPNIDLTNGPGYPIFLMPFLALKLPLICITLMNALFYYLSIILLFKALQGIVSFGISLTFSLGWACYYIAYQNIPLIHTETFTFLLISLLTLSVMRAFMLDNKGKVKKYIILSGFVLGYLVLTKMIFGYVLMLMLTVNGLLWLLNRNSIDYRKSFIILMIAFFTTAPYLLYTYHLTGRIFYWGNGSPSLYWMSTPFEGEYGDWKGDLSLNPVILGNFNIHGADSVLKAHHQQDFNEINKYKGIEKDDAFRRLALQNIKSHPLKFAQNIIYNTGRLVFHFPFSYAIQRPKNLLVYPINGILLTLFLFSLIPTCINWRKILFPIRFLLLLALLYLGATMLLSAYVRMLTIIVPILLVWMAFIMPQALKINLKFKE